MSGLLEQIAQNIRARGLFRSGQRILIAVSGGLDSLVLLHSLRELSPARFEEVLRGAVARKDPAG